MAVNKKTRLLVSYVLIIALFLTPLFPVLAAGADEAVMKHGDLSIRHEEALKNVNSASIDAEEKTEETKRTTTISSAEDASSDVGSMADDGFRYVDNGDGTATITGWNSEDYGPVPEQLVIPGEINGLAVTAIGVAAFRSNHLTAVKIPARVKTIGDRAFMDNNLTAVEIPAGVTEIGLSVFADNELTQVMIPDSVKQIGEFAFRNNNLTAVEIPTNVTVIGNNAFYGNKLRAVEIPDRVEIVGAYAFARNELSEVIFPNGLKEIGQDAFERNHLTEVEIPASVTQIGGYAFEDNNIRQAIIHNASVTFGNAVFLGNPDIALIGYEGSTAQAYASEKKHTFVSFESEPELAILYDGMTIDETLAVPVRSVASLTVEYAHSHFEIGQVKWTVDGVAAGSEDTLLLDTDTIGDMTVEVTVTTEYGGMATKRVIISVLLAVDRVQELSDITVLTGTSGTPSAGGGGGDVEQ